MHFGKITLSAAVFAFLAAAPYAFAQNTAPDARTGVSHPDESNIMVTDDAPASPAPQKPSAARPVLRAATEPAAAPSTPTTYPATAPANVDAGIVTRVPGPSNELPVGTLLKIRLNQPLSTVTTPVGTRFEGQLIEPAERDGVVLLPVGTILSGRVTEVHGGRRLSGAAALHLFPQMVTLPDGTRYPIDGQVIDTGLFRSLKVDREGTIMRRDRTKETGAVLGLSTGSGVAAGAIVAGPAGAVVGGAVGAGVGTVVWLKQDRQASLPAETEIVFSLNTPMAVGGK